jgi:hypothetical protein
VMINRDLVIAPFPYYEVRVKLGILSPTYHSTGTHYVTMMNLGL